jgi:C_GCAxxG_C_C family probable redox protein
MRSDMEQPDQALQRFKQGYSCSQSVFSVLAEPLGIETGTALRVASGFGAGIARSAETCGCVTGAIMAIGLRQPDVRPQQNRAEREKIYEISRRMMHEFAQRNGSTRCRELMGCDIGTPEGQEEAQRQDLFRLRCTKFVRDAVEIVNQLVP